jgi:hypothetical protein
VEITPSLARRIKLFVNTLKRIRATHIEEFNDPDGYFKEDGTECEVRIDCAMLRVSEDDFEWKGFFKHSNTTWSTDLVRMKVVDEVLKVTCTPKNRLPLLLESLETEDAQALLEKRMKS